MHPLGQLRTVCPEFDELLQDAERDVGCGVDVLNTRRRAQ